jgi:hypothetical protein
MSGLQEGGKEKESVTKGNIQATLYIYIHIYTYIYVYACVKVA